VGSKPVKRMRLSCSHPGFFCVGDPADADKPFPAEFQKEVAAAGSLQGRWEDVVYDPASDLEPPVLDLSLGEAGELAPDSVLLLPMWSRAQRPGNHSFKMLIHYEAPNPDDKMRYRLVRMEANMHVHHSIRAAVHLRSSASKASELTLAVQVEGVPSAPDSGIPPLSLSGVSCVSGKLAAKPLSAGFAGSAGLEEGNKVVLYYRLQPATPDQAPNPNGQSQISSFVVGGQGKHLALEERPLANYFKMWERRRLAVAFAHDAAALTVMQQAQRGMSKDARKPSGPVRGSSYAPDDVGTRVVLVWQSADGRRAGTVHVACGETDGAARGDQEANVLQQAAGLDAGKLGAGAGAGGAVPQIAKLAVTAMDKPKNCPLQLRVQGPTHTSLVKTGSACFVPVNIVLWNNSWSSALDVVFEALPPTTHEGASESAKVHRGWDFEWGGTVKVVLTVPARGESTIPLTACLFKPGVYNLNRFRVSFPNSTYPAQDFPSTDFQRLLHVDLKGVEQ